MEPSIIYLILLLLIPLFLLTARRRSSQRLPPGSMGLPIVGHSLGFLKAMRNNKAEQWLQERVRKYGPVSKLSLFGAPTVFLHGPAANKFVYTSDSNTLANQQPASIRMIMGERNILELKGDDHRRIRDALVTFLKPEALRNYVVYMMDEEIRMHLEIHWDGKQKISVMPLMKTLTFNVICTLIFGMERGTRRDLLLQLFQKVMEGMLSVPIKLPFTRFNSSLKASAKIRAILRELIDEKREALKKQGASSDQDLISCLLSIHGEINLPVLSDEEIVDNAFVVMLAGYETTSILLTFMVRLLANDPSVYPKVVREQEEIAKNKELGTPLTWDDLAKMKYTWRVATENLRMYPPVFCSFRKTLKDVEYGGYIIPKGWQLVWAACMTHMDDTIFPNASQFDPSRYEQGAAPPYSLIPFGGGPRICPGYEFARIETLTMIHYLVTRFTWKLVSKDDFFYRDPTPAFNQGLLIEIEQKK